MPAKPAAKKKTTPKKQMKSAAVKPTATKAKTAAAKAKPTAKVKTAPRPKPAPVKTKSLVKAKPAPQVATVEQTQESKEMQKFRQMLLAEKARLEAEMEEIESRTSRGADAERATELSSYDDHPADLASETFEREKDLAIGESVQSLLDQVHTAMEKLDRGTYGVCDACGRPIKRARLQALPFATLCVECQDRLEG